MARKKSIPTKKMASLEFRIPAGHLKCIVNRDQGGAAIDREEALRILLTRPQVKEIKNLLKYRGSTARFHVFSYPDPSKQT